MSAMKVTSLLNPEQDHLFESALGTPGSRGGFDGTPAKKQGSTVYLRSGSKQKVANTPSAHVAGTTIKKSMSIARLGLGQQIQKQHQMLSFSKALTNGVLMPPKCEMLSPLKQAIHMTSPEKPLIEKEIAPED